jgi:vanillate O-demethylase monooxygenase subunit
LGARVWSGEEPPVDFFKEFGAFTSNVDRWQHYYLHLPCTAVIDFGCADVDQALGDDDRHQGIQFFALHFMTPVTAGNTIDRWMHLRRTDVGNADVSHRMDDLFRVAFQEDKTILEAIQAEENKDADGEPLRLAIDKGSFVYRKRVAELIAAEASAA